MAVNARIEDLQRKLKARTRPDGSPKQGYGENVASLKAELEQLTSRYGVDNGE